MYLFIIYEVVNISPNILLSAANTNCAAPNSKRFMFVRCRMVMIMFADLELILYPVRICIHCNSGIITHLVISSDSFVWIVYAP